MKTVIHHTLYTELISENINYSSEINKIDTTSIYSIDSTLIATNEIIDNECIVNISHINDNLTNNILSEYINYYFDGTSNKLNDLNVAHYINNNLNFSITIFNSWYCTNILLKSDYFEINPTLIFDKIKNNLNNKNEKVYK